MNIVSYGAGAAVGLVGRNEGGKTLSSQNNQILEMQTQLGKIADENTQLKEKSGKK